MGLNTINKTEKQTLNAIVGALKLLMDSYQRGDTRAILGAMADGFETIDQRLKNLESLTDCNSN